MKTQVENVSDVKKIIHVEIPWEDVDKRIRETVRQISRSARIPGFRPGKAPDSVIRTRFAQHIKEEVMNHVVPEAYQKIVSENNFDIVSEPSLHDVMYSEGSPFLFKVTIETRPTIEAKDYKDLELSASRAEVTDEEVDDVLKTYQERAAELIPLPAETPAGEGTFVSARAKATIEGKKIFEDQTLIDLSSEQNHVRFRENLIGKKAGDAVEFNAEYPEDYAEKAVAGKTVHYQIKVEAVNEKRIPALDDDFAKDLGEFQSLAELRDKVRADLLQFKESEQRSQLKEEILKTVIERNPFEVPEGLIKQETESLLSTYAHTLQKRGVNLQKAQIDWAEVQAELSRQADQNVRGSLLMEAISKSEGIQVTDDDVEQAISRTADQQKRAPEAIKAELIKEEKMDRLKQRLLLSKTMDFLVDHARINYN